MTGWRTYRSGVDPIAEPTRALVLSPWVTPQMAAKAFARSEHTIRTWIRSGEVRSMCLVANQMLVVYWPDVHNVDSTRSRRVRERRACA